MKTNKNQVLSFVVALIIVVGGLLIENLGTVSVVPPSPASVEIPAVAVPPTKPSEIRPEDDTNQSIVTFPSNSAKDNFIGINNIQPSEIVKSDSLENTYIVNRDVENLDTSEVTAYPRIRYRALLTPNDTLYPQWYTEKIAAPEAWNISTGSSAVTVAVIDTGFGLSHEDLAGRWANGGKDFANNDNDPSAGTTNPNGSAVSHGTSTAGLIGATGNNAQGVASINWGAKILPLQALDDDGTGYSDDVTAAVNYAVSQGVKVISLSLGSPYSDSLLQSAVINAHNNGVNVVAAAGNCGDQATYISNGCSQVGQMLYPANYPSVIAVGSSDSNDNIASFSSYGNNLDVVAPGTGSIRSPRWISSNQTSSYSSSLSGTSFSTPIVAGLLASTRGLDSALNATQTSELIAQHADKTSGMSGQNFSPSYGFGRINAYRTLKAISPTFVNAYAGQSDSPTTVASGAAANAYFLYKNTGNQIWYDDTGLSEAPAGTKPMHLATSQPINRQSSLSDSWINGNRPALNFAAVYEADGTTLTSNQHLAQPGQIVKFEFNFRAGANLSPGIYREHFQPIIEGGSTMNDPGTYLDVTVQPPIYSAAYAGQSGYPTSITPGGPATPVYFLYKNTGNQAWYDDTSLSGAPAGTKPMHLATSRPINRLTGLQDSWINGNRPALNFAAVYEADGTTLASNQHVAQPGQIVKFAFNFRAPAGHGPGTWREHFQPIIEGGSTMNDPGTYLDATVQK